MHTDFRSHGPDYYRVKLLKHNLFFWLIIIQEVLYLREMPTSALKTLVKNLEKVFMGKEKKKQLIF